MSDRHYMAALYLKWGAGVGLFMIVATLLIGYPAARALLALFGVGLAVYILGLCIRLLWQLR